MVTSNVWDQAARYTVRLDPQTFFRWTIDSDPSEFRFQEWLDTRNVPFPLERDRSGDNVARFTDLSSGGEPWALAVEAQSEPDPEMFGRMLVYCGSVWLALKPDEEAGSRYWVQGVVVNLTGRGREIPQRTLSNPKLKSPAPLFSSTWVTW